MKHSRKHNDIITLYMDRYMGVNTIARALGLSRSYVYKVIKLSGRMRSFNDGCKLASAKRKGSLLSDVHKSKISKSMKSAHSEGRHPGWRHINTDPSRRSYPERIFMNNLIKYGVTEKYTVVEQLPINKYFLDFAVIDLKLDIEIDGGQHVYNQVHDKMRDAYLNSHGWRIYRISWNELKHAYDIVMNELIAFIHKLDENCNRYYAINDVKLVAIKKFGTRSEYNTYRKQSAIIRNQSKIDLIMKSDIDFGKFGWVSQVSSLLDMQPQRVHRWMIKYMNSFYEENCFKRK